MACLEDLAAAHADARVLVVAHTTLVRNCAISEVRLGGRRPALLELNSPV